MNEIALVAVMHLDPERVDEALDVLREAVPVVRAEAGCLAYDVHTLHEDASTGHEAPEPGTLLLTERWASREALDAHMTEPGIAILRSKLPAVTARRPEVYEIATLLALDRNGMDRPWVFHQEWAPEELTFVCVLHVDAERLDEVHDILGEAVTTFNAEEGCLAYDFHAVKDDPATLVLVDRYADRGTLERHLAGEGIARLRSRLPGVLTAPSDVYPTTALQLDRTTA